MRAATTHIRPEGGPDVLILMATHNGARFLSAQLESIATQDSSNWALHVSDDASDDTTRTIVADFARNHPGHDIRLHEGPGRGAAANFLSLLTRADLPLGPNTHVALADQDDVWLPHKLSRALERLHGTEGEAVIYGAQSLHVDTRGRVCGGSRPPGTEVTFASSLVRNAVSGHSLVLNPTAVELARRAGAPDVAFHDWWLSMLIPACGGRVIVDEAIVLHYRQHDTNVLGGPGGPAAALRRMRLILNGSWGRWFDRNLDALRGLSLQEDAPVMTAEAQTLLAALAAAPPYGRGRAAEFRRLGLRREGRAQDRILRLAAWAGRV